MRSTALVTEYQNVQSRSETVPAGIFLRRESCEEYKRLPTKLVLFGDLFWLSKVKNNIATSKT